MNYKKGKGKTVKNLINIPEKEFINFLVEDLQYSPKSTTYHLKGDGLVGES